MVEMFDLIQSDPKRALEKIKSGEVNVNTQMPPTHGSSSITTNATMLMKSSEVGNLEIVKALIKAGANVNAKTMEPYILTETPLGKAVEGCHVEIVKNLIAAGANVNIRLYDHIRDDYRPTLLYAFEDGMKQKCPGLIKVLKDAGAKKSRKP